MIEQQCFSVSNKHAGFCTRLHTYLASRRVRLRVHVILELLGQRAEPKFLEGLEDRFLNEERGTVVLVRVGRDQVIGRARYLDGFVLIANPGDELLADGGNKRVVRLTQAHVAQDRHHVLPHGDTFVLHQPSVESSRTMVKRRPSKHTRIRSAIIG
jgi:hypothetical protein